MICDSVVSMFSGFNGPHSLVLSVFFSLSVSKRDTGFHTFKSLVFLKGSYFKNFGPMTLKVSSCALIWKY